MDRSSTFSRAPFATRGAERSWALPGLRRLLRLLAVVPPLPAILAKLPTVLPKLSTRSGRGPTDLGETPGWPERMGW
jgi:hypothetical protein